MTHYGGIKEDYSYRKSLQQSFDSQDYKETSVREVQKYNYREKRLTEWTVGIVISEGNVFRKERVN